MQRSASHPHSEGLVAFLEGQAVPGFEIEFMQVYKDGERPADFASRRVIAPELPRRWPPPSTATALLARLDELASIGADAAVDDPHRLLRRGRSQAVALACRWLRGGGADARPYDQFGNLFASTDGNAARRAVSFSGRTSTPCRTAAASTAPLVSWRRSRRWRRCVRWARCLPLPLEVVVWRCEEPVRFAQGKVGSLLFSRAS